MKLYSLDVEIKNPRGKKGIVTKHETVDASEVKYARNKIARKYKVTPRSVKVLEVRIIGYF